MAEPGDSTEPVHRLVRVVRSSFQWRNDRREEHTTGAGDGLLECPHRHSEEQLVVAVYPEHFRGGQLETARDPPLVRV